MPFKPGQSGNKKGRPPKSLAFADKIRAAISDEELIRFAVDAVRNPEFPTRERVYLHSWLADRSHGKAPVNIKIESSNNTQLPEAWAVMTSRERDAWFDQQTDANQGRDQETLDDDPAVASMLELT